jgi:ABC-type bacteriocin/lantibiotic exporter with double-glycine peptidase domain
VTETRQRSDGDCGCSCLSAVLGHSYEDVYVEVSHIDPKWRGKQGLYNREMIAVAARLGVRLQATRRFDLDSDEGVLRVRPDSKRSPINEHGHFVVLEDGFIYCPKVGSRWPSGDYLERYDAKPCTLLKVVA